MDLSSSPLRSNAKRGGARAIVLTSHPRNAVVRRPVMWGAADAERRGPVVATLKAEAGRNVIGAHAGAYSVYRALAIAAGQLDPAHRPDLTNTRPAVSIGPFPQWSDPD